MKGVRPPPCWPCQTNSTVWFHSAATGGNKIKKQSTKKWSSQWTGWDTSPVAQSMPKIWKIMCFAWFDCLNYWKYSSQREGSPPLLAMLQRILQLGSTALPLVATKNNRKELRGVRPPPLFHAKNVWNVLFDMVYGLMVSCHAMLKILRLHYPKVTLHYVIMLPLVASSPVPTIPSQFPSYFFLALPHQFGNFAEIGFEPSSYQSHLTHFFSQPQCG